MPWKTSDGSWWTTCRPTLLPTMADLGLALPTAPSTGSLAGPRCRRYGAGVFAALAGSSTRADRSAATRPRVLYQPRASDRALVSLFESVRLPHPFYASGDRPSWM